MRSRLLAVAATLALAFLLVTNPVLAEAAKQITGKQIKNGSVTGKDVKDASLAGTDVQDGSLGGGDLAPGSVTDGTVADGSLTGSDVRDASLSGADLADGTLTRGDLGILWAEVADTGALVASSGAVTATGLVPTGYQVTFERSVAGCATFATLGSSADGGRIGMVSTSGVAGTPSAVRVDTYSSAGAATLRAFRVLVVC